MSELSQDLRMVEALLFASPDPVDEATLSARLPEGADIAAVLAELQGHYTDRGVHLVRIAGGWMFRTAPELAGLLRIETSVARKLSRAAVETLAIIAYHQPVTRAEVEEIRGVAVSRGTVDILLEAGWIRPRGRRRTPGRPATWGTTASFLVHFGLDSLDDLPGIDDLKAAGLLAARPVYGIGGYPDDAAAPDEEDAAEEADFVAGEADPGDDATEEAEDGGERRDPPTRIEELPVDTDESVAAQPALARLFHL